MLNVLTPEEVLELIRHEFHYVQKNTEIVSLKNALGRTLAEDISADEFVPDFNRSTVDGYAVRARDTFGCSDSIPAVLPQIGEVFMGEAAPFCLQPDSCAAVPTGGAVPDGADSVVMLEYTENYRDGTIGIMKPSAPGQNMIFRGDDVYPGKVILSKGRTLSSQDIGALAAIGRTQIPVERKLRVGVISTGDELVPSDQQPGAGQVRDVNSPMLYALLTGFGADVQSYGIVHDDEQQLFSSVSRAVSECDAVILSGGSSVGVKDASLRIIESLGTVLFHGIAIKPGKPTIFGKSGNIPLIGLPGHPVAAFFITKLFVVPLLSLLNGRILPENIVSARLSESVNANHGRAQYLCCQLEQTDQGLVAHPLRGKSGLITTLAGAGGYFCIDRDCEGLPGGAEVSVTICIGE